jgi:hypothetical protein
MRLGCIWKGLVRLERMESSAKTGSLPSGQSDPSRLARKNQINFWIDAFVLPDYPFMWQQKSLDQRRTFHQ